MARYIKEGNTICKSNDSRATILYGDVVKLGTRVGIAASNISPGEIGSISVVGVYEMAAEKTEVFSIGDTVYLNESGNITKTKGDTIAGWIVEDKPSGTPVAIVKIG